MHRNTLEDERKDAGPGDLAFSLEFKGGKAFLCLDSMDMWPWLRVERLEMELPGLSFPFDFGKGLRRFRTHRCQLSLLEASLDLKAFVEEISKSREMKNRFVSLAVFDDRILVYGSLGLGREGVPFSVRFGLTSHQGEILVHAEDTCVYEKGSLPASVVVSSLFGGCGVDMEGSPPLSFHLTGPDRARGRILDAILWELFLPAGWKLPEKREDEPQEIFWENAKLRIVFGDSETLQKRSAKKTSKEAIKEGKDPEKRENQEKAEIERGRAALAEYEAHREAERWLLEGRLDEAQHHYWKAAERDPENKFVLKRALELGLCFSSRRGEVVERAKEALERWPRWVPALMALGAFSLGQGEPIQAVMRFSRVISIFDEEGRGREALVGSLACGKILEEVDPEQAMGWYSRVLREDPGNMETQRALSKLYRNSGRWKELVTLLRRRASEGTKEERLEAHLELGRCHLDLLEDPLRARAEFEKAIRMDEGFSPAWLGLARAHLSNREAQRALTALGRVEALLGRGKQQGVSTAFMHVKKGQALQVLGRSGEAAQSLQKALVEAPYNAEVLETATAVYGELERWDELAEVLRKRAERKDSPVKERLHLYGKLVKIEAFQREDMGAAKLALDEALILSSEDVEILSLAARIAESTDNKRELLDYLTRLLEVEGDEDKQAEILVKRARLLVSDGNENEALVEELEKVVESQGEYSLSALDVLASIHRRRGDKERLARSLERWMEGLQGKEKNEKKAVSRSMELAKIFYQQGSKEGKKKAKRYLIGAVDLAPDNPEPLEKLASMLEEQGEKQQLESVIQRLVSLLRKKEGWPNLGEYLTRLGGLRLAMGRPEQAAEVLKEASRLEVEDPEVLKLLARAEYSRGDLESAGDAYIQLWERGLGDDEERAELAYYLANIGKKRGDLGEAVEYFRAALNYGLKAKDKVKECWKGVCDALVTQEKWEEAAEAYKEMAEDPALKNSEDETATLLFTRVKILHKKLNKSDQAIVAAGRVLELRPNHHGALNTLEFLYGRQELWEKQAQVIQKKIDIASLYDAERVALLGRLAWIQQAELNGRKEARSNYEKALEIDDSFRPALLFVARDDYETGQLEKSWASYGRLLENLKNHGVDDPAEKHRLFVEIHGRLAQVAAKFSWGDELVEHASWVLENDPGNQQVLQLLDSHYTQKKDWISLVTVLRKKAEVSSGVSGLETKLRLGEVLSEQLAQRPEAAEVYRGVLRDHPSHEKALMRLAEVLLEDNRGEERLKVLERLYTVIEGRDGEEKSFEIRRNALLKEMGKTAAALQKYTAAKDWLLKCLNKNPRDEEAASALVSLARRSRSRDALDAALQALYEATEDKSVKRETRLERVRIFLEEEDAPEKALEILGNIPEREITSHELVLRAEGQEKIESWEEAFSTYERLAEEETDSKKEMEWRKRLFMLASEHLRDDEAAELHGLKLLEELPEDTELARSLAQIYERQGDVEMMRRMLERQLKALEESADSQQQQRDLLVRLARSWRTEPKGGAKKAEFLCRKALEKDSEDLEVLELLYEVQLSANAFGRGAETLEALIQRVEREPLDVDEGKVTRWHLELAKIYEKLGQGLRVRSHVKKALETSTGETLIIALDLWLSQAGQDEQWQEVVEAGERLLEYRQEDEDRWVLSHAYEELGRLDESISVLMELEKKDPGRHDLKERLKNLYALSGRHGELAKEYERDAESAENNEDAFHLLLEAADHFSSAEGGGSDALRCLLSAWDRAPGHREVAGKMEALLGAESDVEVLVRHFREAAEDERAKKENRSYILMLGAQKLLSVEGEEKKVEALLLQAIELDPTNKKAREIQRGVLEARGDWTAVTQALQGWFKSVSTPQMQLELGLSLARVWFEKLEDPQKAIRVLEEIEPEDEQREYYQLLADCYEAAGRLQEAEGVLGRLAVFVDSAWKICIHAAELSARRNDYVAQRGWLKEALETGGPGKQLAEKLVTMERQIGETDSWAEGLELLARFSERPEEKAEVVVELAQVVKVAQPERSLRLYREAIDLVPKELSYRRQLADLALDNDELEIALEELSTLHELLPGDNADARGEVSVRMAIAVHDIGEDKEAARDLYRRAADEFQSTSKRLDALRQTAILSKETENSGLEEEALRALLEFLEESTETLDMMKRLVDLSARREAWNEVLALCERLKEKKVNTVHTLRREAAALEALGRWESAARAWVACAEDSQTLVEKKPEMFVRAAALLRDRLEDPEKALRLLKKALTQSPGDENIATQAEALCQRHERWDDLIFIKELSMRGRNSTAKAKTLHAMAVITERRLGDPDGAATLLARAHGEDPLFYPVLRPLGEYHFRLREWAPSRDYFLQALEDPELSPKSRVDILDRLARISRALGQMKEELDCILEAAQIAPGRDDLWERVSDVLGRQGDDERLFEVLKTRADLSKGPERAKHLLEAASLVDKQLGRPEEALSLYETVVEISPESVVARRRLLELLRERGEWERLGQRLRSELLLVKGPQRAQVAEELASLLEGNDEEAAEHYWRMAYREDPGNTKRIRGLADHLAKRHRWQDLVDFLEMALDTVALPEKALSGFMALLGRTYLEKIEDPDRALEVFERAGLRNALTSRSVNFLAEIYRKRGRVADLVKLLEKEAERGVPAAKRKEILEELGRLYGEKLEKWAEAAAVYRQIFDLDPMQNLTYGQQAVKFLLEASRYEEAERLAELVAQEAPDERRAEAELSWGLILVNYLGREEEAMEVLSGAVDKRPDLAAGHLALGKILFTRGDLDRSSFHLEIVAEGEVSNKAISAEAHQLAGAAAEELNRFDDAKRHYEAAQGLDPTNEDVLRSLDRLYTSMGLWSELSAVLAKQIALEATPLTKAKLWYRRALLSRDILEDEGEALRCLKEAVAAAPQFVEAVSALRQASVSSGDWGLAVQLVKREIDHQAEPSRLAELYMTLGKLFEDHLHQPSKALEAYGAALAYDTSNPKPAEALARTLSYQGRWVEAAKLIEEFVERRAGVDKGPLFSRAAQLYTRAGDRKGAKRVWLRVLEETDEMNWPGAIEGVLGSLEQNEGAEGFLEILGQTLEETRSSEVRLAVLRGLTKTLVLLDRPEQADAYVEEILSRAPGDRTAFLHRRRLLEKRDDAEGLRKLLEKRLEVSEPDEQPDILFNLGNIYRDNGDLAAASSAYKSLLEMDADNTGALDARADLAYQAGEFELAQELYVRLGRGPSSLGEGQLLFRRGEISEALGDEKAAVDLYKKAVETNPSLRVAWEALARIYLFRGDERQAVKALERLWEFIPVEEYETIKQLGEVLLRCLLSLGRFEEAENTLNRLHALELEESPEMWVLSLDLYEKTERWRDAVSALERLSRLIEDPKKKARNLFKEGEILRLHLGDEEGAADRYLKAADLDPLHLPTARRLAEHFSRSGDWRQLVDVCGLLLDNEPVESNTELARIEYAVGLILDGGADAVKAPGVLRDANLNYLEGGYAVKVLSDASIGLRNLDYTMAPMGRVLDALNSSFGDEVIKEWAETARNSLEGRQGDVGLRRLMPRLEARVARRKTALEHSKILAFLDPQDPSIGDFKKRATPTSVPANALDVDGVLCPEGLKTPLRKALVQISPLLAGFKRQGGEDADGYELLQSALSAKAAARVQGLIKRLRVAQVNIRVGVDPGFRVDLFDRATPLVVVSRGFLDRPLEELVFILSRRLEWVRSGSLLFLDREDKERDSLVLELACALGVAVEKTNVSSESIQEWRDWLGRGFGALNQRQQSEIMAALKESVGRCEDLGTYLAAQNQMAQRVALMACGDLSVALRAAALEIRGGEVLDPSALESREGLLSGDPGMAELVRFGVSEKRKKILRSSTITGY